MAQRIARWVGLIGEELPDQPLLVEIVLHSMFLVLLVSKLVALLQEGRRRVLLDDHEVDWAGEGRLPETEEQVCHGGGVAAEQRAPVREGQVEEGQEDEGGGGEGKLGISPVK